MELMSSDFQPAGNIPAQFTCQGKGVSPAVSWSHIPEGTRSFALAVLDPDAPGRQFLHWVVYDIPAGVHELPQGGPLPPGAKELPNDFGQPGWGGPCPTAGPHEHRYQFTVYALDVPSLGQLTRKNWASQIKAHTLASARLEGRYSMH